MELIFRRNVCDFVHAYLPRELRSSRVQCKQLHREIIVCLFVLLAATVRTSRAAGEPAPAAYTASWRHRGWSRQGYIIVTRARVFEHLYYRWLLGGRGRWLLSCTKAGDPHFR